MAITALIVDDEPLARKRIRRLLHAAKDLTIVGEAAGGEEALRIVDEQAPQVMFLDVQMPRMDGFEVVRRMPAESLIIVAVTLPWLWGETLVSFWRAVGFPRHPDRVLFGPLDPIFFLGIALATLAQSRYRAAAAAAAKVAELETSMLRVRATLLRLQLNPHFLFNSLNSVAALLEDDAPTPTNDRGTSALRRARARAFGPGGGAAQRGVGFPGRLRGNRKHPLRRTRGDSSSRRAATRKLRSYRASCCSLWSRTHCATASSRKKGGRYPYTRMSGTARFTSE